MYVKRCFRTLDRALEFFGLEPEDWGLLIIVSGVLLFLAGPLVGCAVAISGYFGLRRLKSGKPPGYLFCLFYRSGLIHLVPSTLRPRGLLRPPGVFSANQRIHLSAFYAESDYDSGHVRFFYDI